MKFTEDYMDMMRESIKATKERFGYNTIYEKLALDALDKIERQTTEIEKLRVALRGIWDLTHNKKNIRLIDALYDIDQIIKQTLKEVNDD